MKVDVILVTYNHESYVEEAFNSILLQRLPDNCKLEIIIADDASSDNTYNILEGVASQSPYKVTFLPKESNLGHPKNYQRAFNACNGDYIAILEGDDYWSSPLHILNHISFLDSHRECVLSMNRSIFYHQQDSFYELSPYPYVDAVTYISGKDMARGNCLGNLSSCVVRRQVLDRLDDGIFDLDMDDWLLGLSLAQYGLLCKFKEATSVWRIHSGGQWSGLTEVAQCERMVNQIDAYDKFLDGIYHEQFMLNKNYINKKLNSSKKNNSIKEFKKYIPPIVITIAKSIIPPIFIDKRK